MKQTEKKEVVNFVLSTLADGCVKTGSQLMELFVTHASLQEFNRKNLKQVFHRVCLSLAEQSKLTVTRQPGTAPLLFSVRTHNQDTLLSADVPSFIERKCHDNSEGSLTLTQKLEDLTEQEAMLRGRENGLRMLLEIAPEKRNVFEMELKKIRYERKAVAACRQVIEEYGHFA